MNDKPLIPVAIELHRQSRKLDLRYADGQQFSLECEYLRVYSPSAEVRGHGVGQETLQTGKINVTITEIKSVGNYALQFTFSDGHDTGIYSWNYLHELCVEESRYWDDYLRRLHDAGASRDPEVQVVRLELGVPASTAAQTGVQQFDPGKK
ncbi:MAG: DUF971 domain-containing protein [Spongiibacteraceae bacterium]